MKRGLRVLVVSLLLSVLFLGLFTVVGFSGKKLKFAWCPTITDPFYFMIGKGAKAAAEKYGVDLFVSEYPKAWGPEIQIPILKAVAARGDIDLLFTGPASKDALIPVLKEIYDMGIEIITVDTYIGDGKYTHPPIDFPLSFIGTDNFQGGVEIAHRLAKMIGGKGKVFVETTNPDVSSVAERVAGFKKGIQDYPDIKLVGVEYNLDSQEKAQAQVAAALQANPDIKGIFGTNLYSAQGAYQAVVNAGLTGAVKIASWDATVDLINALKAGKVDLVLAQRPYDMGYLAVEWGYKYFTQNAKVPKRINPGFFFFTRENVNDPEAQKFIYK